MSTEIQPDIYDLAGEPRPKLCCNCKHLAKSSISGPENWKCFAEQNITSRELDLVTGLTVVKRRWLTCYEARAQADFTCGPEGRWFEEAPPKFEEPTVRSPAKLGAADLLSQLNSMK